ncbi:hypothetical protein [Altericista sp. CCNU0014]|uniref:hypothetical protein n=1 Tax=Altericista sp. CCNU0014 TaxID=3082949 RepID=UPI003850E1D9
MVRNTLKPFAINGFQLDRRGAECGASAPSMWCETWVQEDGDRLYKMVQKETQQWF